MTSDVAVAELLDELRALRLTMSSDLAAAAGAVEASELAVARDILSADSQELQRFVRSTRDRAPADARPARRHRVSVASIRPPISRWRRRALLALPAVPLAGALAVTAAAAVGVGPGASHHHPSHAPRVATAPGNDHPAAAAVTRASHSARTTLVRLERVVNEHPTAPQVITVAAQLHRQITKLIAANNPDRSQIDEIAQLLSTEQRVLKSHITHVESVALAASRRLLAQLPRQLSSLPVVTTPPTPVTPPALSPPSATPTQRPATSPSPSTTTNQSHRHRARAHSTHHAPSSQSGSHAPKSGVLGLATWAQQHL